MVRRIFHHRELLALNTLQYNSKIWRNKCNEKYLHYRFMVDSQEYFLWKQYNIKTKYTTKDEFQLKISNLGRMFHNPSLPYQIQSNGQIYFTPLNTKPIAIGKPVFFFSQNIYFPLEISLNVSRCNGNLENIYYLKSLMNILNLV